MQISPGQTDFTTIAVAERPPDQRRGRPSFPRWFSEVLGVRNDDCDHQIQVLEKNLRRYEKLKNVKKVNIFDIFQHFLTLWS